MTRVAARVWPTQFSVNRQCGALASGMHRPCMAPARFHRLPSPSLSPALALIPPLVLTCTPVLRLLVPLPQHWNQPTAHVASPSKRHEPWSLHHTAMGLPRPPECVHTAGGCLCWNLCGLAPSKQTMAGCTNQHPIHSAHHKAVTVPWCAGYCPCSPSRFPFLICLLSSNIFPHLPLQFFYF